MSGSSGSVAFQLAFQISPLIFTGGIAQQIPGGMLPVGLVTASQSLLGGLLSVGTAPSLDQVYPKFQPLPGGTLASYQIGTYPFANQAVAANATIAQPLDLSVLMFWPAQPATGGYAARLIGITAMQSAISAHGSMGGTYTYITPAYFYTNLILTEMKDVTMGQSKQPQSEWQLDFKQPLLTLDAAQAVQNSLMSKLTSGSPTDGTWSGASGSLGLPNSLQASNVIPSAGGSPASIASPYTVGNM